MKNHIGGGFVSADYNWEKAGIDSKSAEAWIKKDGMLLKEGYIAMQAESHAIDFKNIELLDLKGCMDKKAKNYRILFYQSG
jgi:hypothetical protein